MRNFVKWFLRNTLKSTDHMTPQIALRLITSECPLWFSQPENCPFPDPYWAFYWPGGQVLTRYLTDNADTLLKNRRIFDLGSGCGSVAVAALLYHCQCVTANDVDQNALLSTALNCKLNNVFDSEKLRFDCKNRVENSALPLDVDVITVGDMFYDDEFAASLTRALRRVRRRNPKIRVLIGDPGRGAFAKVGVRRLAKYALPANLIQENYGYSCGAVYTL